MSRWPLPFVIAFAALALQACDQRPAQTTVSPPQASLPDDASLRAPAAPPLVTAQAPAAPAAPPASAASASAAPETTAQATQSTTSGDNPTPPAQAAAADASAPVAVTSPTPEPAAPATAAMGAAPPAPAAVDTTPAGVAAPTEMSRFFEPAAPASAAKPEAAKPAATKPEAKDKVSSNLPAVRDPGDTEGARLLAQRSLQLPVVGIQPTALSDMYEQTRGSRKHEAIDILAPLGTPVVAVDDGRIAKLFNSKPGGLTVYQFDPEARLAYYYAHLQRYADLREGLPVKRGDLIGYVGTSGNADVNTPHLHFAVFKLGNPPRWWEGAPVNPYPALSRAQPADQVAAR
jgi:murein DD-endopeptidase MepM/ murein hydrolase activator NlpD